MVPLQNLILCLGCDGKEVELNNYLDHGHSFPEQAEAAACKTHEQVLAFLNKLKDSPLKHSISCMHYNNKHYKAHRGEGTTHNCSLLEQIAFVEQKMHETQYPARKVCCVIQ